ncbi:MAG: hypothetical protein J7L80_01995 [Thermoplasmata archaeon]|nr:hypothetical protein [Thermoplasmata archaeon]
MKKKFLLFTLFLSILLSCTIFQNLIFANQFAKEKTNYFFSVVETGYIRFKGLLGASIAREGKINETHFYHFQALNDEISIAIYDGDGLEIRVYNDTQIIISSFAISSDGWDYFNFSNAHGNYTIEIKEDSFGYLGGNYYGLMIDGTNRIFMNINQSILYPGYSPSQNYYGTNDAMIVGKGAFFSRYETYEIFARNNSSVAIYDGDGMAVLIYDGNTLKQIFLANSNNAWDTFNITPGKYKVIVYDIYGINDYYTGGNFYRLAVSNASLWLINESLAIKTYDYSNNAGIDRYAYRYQTSSAPPSSNDIPSTEFSPIQYQNISYDDGIEQIEEASLWYYASHRFVFNIGENATLLHITWKGRGWHNFFPLNGARLYIWNCSSNSYELLDYTTGGSITMLEGVIVNPSHYIQNGNVTILVVGNGYSFWLFRTFYSYIATDYIKLEVIN